jgi:hypothetical protein
MEQLVIDRQRLDDGIREPIRWRAGVMLPLLNERQRRLYLACEAQSIGTGGVAEVSRITGVSPGTIKKGIKEIADGAPVLEAGQSRISKGRKGKKCRYPDIMENIKEIIEDGRRGEENYLHYTARSAEGISAAMKEKGIDVSPTAVANLLKKDGYNLRRARGRAGSGGPGVERQFVYINKKVGSYLARGEPVVVIEAKSFNRKRCGNNPVRYDRDYLQRELEKPDPGIWHRLFLHRGFLNVGLDGAAAETAVECLGKWYEEECFERYRNAGRLLVVADFCEDGGGWAVKLRELAEKTQTVITVLHFPLGITKWSGVGHRFYSFIGGGGRFIRTAIIMSLIGPGGGGATVDYFTESGDPREGGDRTFGTAAEDDAFSGEWDRIITPRTRPRLEHEADGQYGGE